MRTKRELQRMKIEIISDDRLDSSQKNLSRVAWELSRSPDDKTPLDTILSIDAPVNEVPSIVMSVECTILEREIFASFRDHVMWARTSRRHDTRHLSHAHASLLKDIIHYKSFLARVDKNL